MDFNHLLLPIVSFISLSSLILVHGNTSLIENTCRTTKYYDLCVSSLKSNSTSLTADSKGLAMIMTQVAMANASATNAFLSSRVLSITNDKVMEKLLKDCGQEYGYAVDALRNSAQDLGDEAYDSAYIHAMGAADYPNVCHNGFRRYPLLPYPSQLAQREDGLKRLCNVLMGLIDNLAL